MYKESRRNTPMKKLVMLRGERSNNAGYEEDIHVASMILQWRCMKKAKHKFLQDRT